jgi:GNAT superfamily N-acetyltransferase
MTRSTLAGVNVRRYEDRDERAVLGLLTASLGGGPTGVRSAEFFRWKHFENPFGRSLMLVAESQGEVVGLRAFMRWEFVSAGRILRAVRAVDTATHPEHQGRGIFSRLTLEAIELLRGDADLVFNTPNEKSLPGYLKMGWRIVGRVPVRVRVRRPIAFVRGIRSVTSGMFEPAPASSPLAARPSFPEDSEIEGLLRSAEHDGRIATVRSAAYLRWRYAGAPPLLGYGTVLEMEGSQLRGMVLFRLRSRGRLLEASVGDMLVREGDRRTGARLLRRVAQRARVDHLTCSFAARRAGAGASLRAGFLPAPTGPTLAVRAISSHIAPDPFDLGSWALSLGDVEVF